MVAGQTKVLTYSPSEAHHRLSSTELQKAVLRNFLMEDGASPLKYLAKGVLRGRVVIATI